MHMSKAPFYTDWPCSPGSSRFLQSVSENHVQPQISLPEHQLQAEGPALMLCSQLPSHRAARHIRKGFNVSAELTQSVHGIMAEERDGIMQRF